MYQKGDFIVKPNTGICRIDDILYLDIMHSGSEKLYYLLIPISDEKAKIYIPVSTTSDSFRKVLNVNEAWDLIHKISQIDAMRIENDKQREQKYKEAIKSCNLEQLVSIIKTMYMRNQKRTAQGKKTTSMDDHYFKLAEDLLYSELAFALEKNKNEMCALISETINNSEKEN